MVIEKTSKTVFLRNMSQTTSRKNVSNADHIRLESLRWKETPRGIMSVQIHPPDARIEPSLPLELNNSYAQTAQDHDVFLALRHPPTHALKYHSDFSSQKPPSSNMHKGNTFHNILSA